MLRLLLLLACVGAGSNPEAISLLGEPLFAPQLSEETRRDRENLLAAAQRAYDVNPRFPEAIIWLGRRAAYLGRYRDAIEIFSRGVQQYPNDPRFLRHRGHRYITTRQLDRAVADFEKAALLIENGPDHIEPDGLPNRLKIPTSTLHFNVWYHLGLAHYLRGDFERAARAYRACMDVSKHADSIVATTHWYYMTLRRLGRHNDAASLLADVQFDETSVIETESYLQLLKMYRGEITPDVLMKSDATSLDAATIGYGVGNYLLYTGRRDEAIPVLKKVLGGGEWPAFGYIAAEAEMARIRPAQP